MIQKQPRSAFFGQARFLSVCLAAAGAAALGLGSAKAQVSVLGSANFDIGTGIYTYSYAVFNGGLFELALVDVEVATASALMSLTAPTGFDISYDPGLGIVSFFEDTEESTLQTFSPSSFNGLFSFTSLLAPDAAPFEALDVTGETYSGTTLAPLVPEPGSVALLSLALLAPAALSRRRAATAPLSHSSQHQPPL